MKAFTHTLVVCSISALLCSACSLNRADSLRMLENRADYEAPGREDSSPALKESGIEGFAKNPVPVRTRGQVAACWIVPHETASRDYFWGGWISLVTDEPQWVLSKPGTMPRAPGVVEAAKVRAGSKRTGTQKKKVQAISSNSVNAHL